MKGLKARLAVCSGLILGGGLIGCSGVGAGMESAVPSALPGETLTLTPDSYTTWSKSGTNSLEATHDFGGEVRPAYRVDLPWVKGGKFTIEIPVKGLNLQDDWPTHEVLTEQTQKGWLPINYGSARVRWDGYLRNKDLGCETNFTSTFVSRFKHEIAHTSRWVDSVDARLMSGMSITIPMDTWEDQTKTQTVWVSSVVFTKEDSWKGTDRDADFRHWQKYCDEYEPDYSDSSKCLEPPAEGRLKRPLTLVKNHQPFAEIIAVTDCYGSVEMAARDLQYWIEKMTKAKLPITCTGTSNYKSATNLPVKIWLNNPWSLVKWSADVAWLKAGADIDGWFVHTKQNEIFIGCCTGSDVHYDNAEAHGLPRDACPIGVFRGAIEFLQNNWAIIFASENKEFGTVYDESADLVARWGDGRDRPATCGRGWLSGTDFSNTRPIAPDSRAMWCARNKSNVRLPHRISGHGVNAGEEIEFFPKTNEAYRVCDGEKRRKFDYYQGQVCLGAPDALETAIEFGVAAIDRMREKGNYPIVGKGFWNEDNWGCCICENCTKPVVTDDGRVLESTKKFDKNGNMAWNERVYRSTQYMQFINKLANGIAAKRRGVKTEILAYLFQINAPQCKVSPNVMWTYCPYQMRAGYDTPLYCPRGNWNYNNIKEFLARGGEMHVYDYHCFGGFTGANNTTMEAATEDFRWYTKVGAKLIGSEFAYLNDINNPAGMMNGWLYPQTGWSADLAKLEQLRKWYIRRVYREGAPVVEKYFGGLRRNAIHTHAPDETPWKNPLVGGAGKAEFEKYLPLIKNPVAKRHFETLMKKVAASR